MMKINFIPKTRLGKLAIYFGIVLVDLIVLKLIFAVSIKGDPTVIANNSLLSMLASVLSFIFAITGLVSLIIGIIAIIKHREWLVGKSLALLYGLTILLFLLGEFLFPH